MQTVNPPKKAIIIGASSGIGKELAINLAKNGYEVGLMARRTELLDALKNEVPAKSILATSISVKFLMRLINLEI